MKSARRSSLRLLLPLLALCATGPVAAQETAPAVTLEAISIEPSDPGPDTLCKLRVTLANADERVASQLGFRVTVNGYELPVYGNHLFMYPVEPGTSTEIPLYNFWSTETSRPMPENGKLEVEISLTEAQWMDISIDEEDVEVWTPLGPVEGLPSSASVTLDMKTSG